MQREAGDGPEAQATDQQCGKTQSALCSHNASMKFWLVVNMMARWRKQNDSVSRESGVQSVASRQPQTFMSEAAMGFIDRLKGFDSPGFAGRGGI